METAKTEGVLISVASNFRSDLSEVEAGHFFFTYDITIRNDNPDTVQLLSREWYIFDSLGKAGFITGEGVIGEQPILKNGESFQYMSGCGLRSEIGYMKGFYTFLNLMNNQTFKVAIPVFHLIHPSRLN